MKKVLVLMLVLGMASLANAAFLASFDGSAIVVSADTAEIGGINLGLGVIGPATLGQFVLRTAGAPVSDPAITAWGDVTGYELPWNDLTTIVWGDPVTTANPAGMWFSSAMPAGLALGTEANHTIQVDLLDGNFATLGSVYLIPEPATMLILGLGGLLLRRK